MPVSSALRPALSRPLRVGFGASVPVGVTLGAFTVFDVNAHPLGRSCQRALEAGRSMANHLAGPSIINKPWCMEETKKP